MESHQTSDVNILNRSQLQSALNMFYTTAMKYVPHDEIAFRNSAEILKMAIDQCAPASDDNLDGPCYDFQYDEHNDTPVLQKQFAGGSSSDMIPQVPLQPIKYKGVDLQTHKSISIDIWCQKMQKESSHYLTEQIPMGILMNIYTERNNIEFGNQHSQNVITYLDWIVEHSIDDYEQWRSTPEKFHYYMELKVVLKVHLHFRTMFIILKI